MVSPDGVVNEIIVTAQRSFLVPAPAPVPPPPPPPEALGDLKLYREPATTLGANQSKQVRFVEKTAVPFARLSRADLPAIGTAAYAPAATLLRMKNSRSGHLGSPLPSGVVAVFQRRSGPDLLLGEAQLTDTAVDEDMELKIGETLTLQVHQTKIADTAATPQGLALTPELALAFRRGETVEEVEIVNALDQVTPFELRLQLNGSEHLTKADQPFAMKDGRPLFRLIIPANGSIKVRYSVNR
jgi:hypothetical protein